MLTSHVIRNNTAISYRCNDKGLQNIANDAFHNNNNASNNDVLTLILTYNNIKTLNRVHFENLIQLTHLHIDYNKLTIISEDLFKHNTKLIYVYISHNKILHFNFNLSKLPKLDTLYIDNNKLTYLTDVFKSLISGNESSNKVLSVYHNMLTCNYKMKWILDVNIKIHANISYDSVCYNKTNCSLACFFSYNIINTHCNGGERDYCMIG